jgi:TonB family protein
MRSINLILLFITITMVCNSQDSKTRYYRDRFLSKETSEKKAKYSESKIANRDGSVTTIVKKVKRDKIVRSETYKGNEPYGIWTYWEGKEKIELNYDFDLNYTDTKCMDSIPGFKKLDPFRDYDSLNYKAPVLIGYNSILESLTKNIVFPHDAAERGISGTVYLIFTINEEGEVVNIAITKGVNVILDKEAVRLLRLLKFSRPASLNGQNRRLCFNIPIRWTLN